MPRSQPGSAMQSSPLAHAELSSQRTQVPQLRVTSPLGLSLELPPLVGPPDVALASVPAELPPALGAAGSPPGWALVAVEPPASLPLGGGSSGPDSYLPEQPAPTAMPSQSKNDERAQPIRSR